MRRSALWLLLLGGCAWTWDPGPPHLHPAHVDDADFLMEEEPAAAFDLAAGAFYVIDTTNAELRRCMSGLDALDACPDAPPTKLELRYLDQNEVDGVELPRIAVLHVESLTVPKESGLVVIGDAALVLVARGAIHVDGALTTSGSIFRSGAGGQFGRGLRNVEGVEDDEAKCAGELGDSLSAAQRLLGAGECGVSGFSGATGGAGGSHLGVGGKGGDAKVRDGADGDGAIVDAVGGSASTTRRRIDASVFLVGGGGGGAGGGFRDPSGAPSTLPSAGGSGGGALQLTSDVEIIVAVDALITADGMSGFPTTWKVGESKSTNAARGAGGGGGAGGTVFLEAPSIVIRGIVRTNGAGGAGGDASTSKAGLVGGVPTGAMGGLGGAAVSEEGGMNFFAGRGGKGGGSLNVNGEAGVENDPPTDADFRAAGGGGGADGNIFLRALRFDLETGTIAPGYLSGSVTILSN